MHCVRLSPGFFMTRAEDQTASMGSHLKWYVQAGALPHIPMFEDTVKLLARNSKFDVDNNRRNLQLTYILFWH